MARTSDTKCDVIHAKSSFRVDVFNSTFVETMADDSSGSEDTTSLLASKCWAKYSNAVNPVVVDIL